MTRCHICDLRCEREVEPRVGDCPAVMEPDVYLVAQRNGVLVEACFACWFRWPDGSKRFPTEGFGHPRDGLRTRVVYDERGELLELELLPARGTAP